MEQYIKEMLNDISYHQSRIGIVCQFMQSRMYFESMNALIRLHELLSAIKG